MSTEEVTLERAYASLGAKLRAYWMMVKDLQTGLLVVTGVAGYMSARPVHVTWQTVVALIGSLFLTVGGSTVINMVIDRDIDAIMSRTQHRPLPSGKLCVAEAVVLGAVMLASGLLWAFALAPLYGVMVGLGVFLDMVVYTVWLKRRSAWAIVWGGLAGGMPALAGRVLGTGSVDGIGVALGLAVLFWIPTHMLSFGIRYADEYRKAGVPIIPTRYGDKVSRFIIGLSTSIAIVIMLGIVYAVGVSPGLLWAARSLGGVLFFLTIVTTIRPTEKLNFILYKSASVYMLLSMILLIAGA